MQDIEQVYIKYFEIVNKYLFCLTHSIDISEDLTQETFCRAVKKINSFKGDCKISVWLCQIAKNLWYDELKRKKIKFVDENSLLLMQNEIETEDIIISKDEKLELYKKIQKLDEKTREVIWLRIVGELNFKEIADILNKTENWARIVFYRGKKKLKEVD